MNRNLALIPTVLFFVFVFNAIFLYVVNINKIAPAVVQQVVADETGTIWALVNDNLVDLSDALENRSFSHHGFDFHVGQVIALESGEWILNVGAQRNYVWNAIQRSLDKDDAAYQATGSLLKCGADLLNCEPWGEAGLQFERAFDGLELRDGRLLLFKPAQKKVFLVDQKGFIQSQIKDQEFWFGVTEFSENTWIGLDTNKGDLVQINLDNDQITASDFDISLMSLSGDVSSINSSSKIINYKNSIWVLGRLGVDTESKPKDISEIAEQLNPAPIFVQIDLDTHRATRLPFSFEADAEVERIGDKLYFSDFDKQEIKQFDLITQTMDLVDSTHLQDLFTRDQERVKAEKEKLYVSQVINGLLALAAFIWLLLKSTPVSTWRTKA